MVDFNPHLFVKQCFDIYAAHEYDQLEALRKTDHYKALQKKLMQYLDFCTDAQSFAFSSWTADKDHLGYLRKTEVAFSVRAPYHIVPAFPDSVALNELHELSKAIRTDGRSMLCLSGSMAILKSAVSVSDIDFCEYVKPNNDGSWPRNILKEVDTLDRKITKFKLFEDNQWNRPVPRDQVKEKLTKIDPENVDFSFGKADYLADMKSFRPCETTNLMIFCDLKMDSASLHRSFPAQEVPMSAAAWIPNTFADVYQMGRYYSFLACQGRDYFEKGNPIKSIKRFLSLSRLSFMSETSTEISNFINESSEFAAKEISDIDDVISQLKPVNFPERNSWIEKLERDRAITIARKEQLEKISKVSAKDFCMSLMKKFPIEDAACAEWT